MKIKLTYRVKCLNEWKTLKYKVGDFKWLNLRDWDFGSKCSWNDDSTKSLGFFTTWWNPIRYSKR